MLDTVLSFACDLDRGIDRTAIRPALLTGDSQAHTFRIAVSRSGQAVPLAGAVVSGYFVRADGVTVPITGSASGSTASVTLTDGCYNVPGRFQLVVKLSLSGETSTVFWGDGAVASSRTDAVLDDEGVIPSLDELLAQIAATEAAAASANSAASAANSAASSANSAASRANTAAASVESMSAKATTLSPGSQATASMATVDGVKVLTIGVPQGIQGPQGPKGDPGKDGSGSVSTVNGVEPVQGNVTLTASDVGALPEGGTAANASLLGGKAPEYYLQPMNLLDNSDFSNPVAQAGLNGTHGSTVYAVDRWIANGCTAEQSTGCLKLTTSRSYAHIWQKVTGVAGKTLTCAAKFSGAGVGAIRVYDESITTKYAEVKNISVVGCVAFTVPDDVDTITVLLYPNQESVSSGLIYWAALYEGSYTADTLPPYVPKGYAAELAECRRYYKVIDVYVAPWLLETTTLRRYYVGYEPMRTTPTVDVSGLKEYATWTDLASTMNPYNIKNNRVLISATAETTSTRIYMGGSIALSADL